MAVGFGLLRLSPHDFWSMTPREIAAAMGALTAPGGMRPDRADMDAMMRMFPD